MSRQAGFTLIEVLTAGVLSTILAGALLSLLYMANSQIQESLTRQNAIMVYNAISDQIHGMARRAKTVRSEGEAGGIGVWPVPDHPANVGGYQDIIFFDENNVEIGGFQIHAEPGILDLRERVDGGWQTYRVAGAQIFLDDDQAYSFSITADRMAATFQFDLEFTMNGITVNHRFPREIVRCRNVVLE